MDQSLTTNSNDFRCRMLNLKIILILSISIYKFTPKPNIYNSSPMNRLKMLLLITTVIFCFSCDTDQDDMDLVDTELIALNELLVDTEWRVSNFAEDGIVKTSDFEDYIFAFEGSNELKANTLTGKHDGTWRVSNNTGTEYDSANDLDFTIFFTPNGKLGGLTNAYDVISANSSEIKLMLEKNANGNTGFLTFIRN